MRRFIAMVANALEAQEEEASHGTSHGPLVLFPLVVALAAAAPSPPRLSSHGFKTDPVILCVGQEKRFLVGYWREPVCDDLRLVDVSIRNVSKDDNEIRFRGRQPGTTLCRVFSNIEDDYFILIPIVVH